MKKVIWWLLAVPLIPLGLVYVVLRGVTKLGEKAEDLTDRMFDWPLRLKYIAWRNKKFG